MSEETSKVASGKSDLWDTAKTVIYAIVIAFFIRTVAYEPFNIPSGSMIPTLLVGDYLFVSKYSYGYSNHSLPMSPRVFSGRIFATTPERGDVAVFKTPRDNETDFIKRIVGLPGDRIQVKRGRLYINRKMVRRDPIEAYFDKRSGSTAPQFIETLPNGRKHRILETLGDTGPLDNTPEYTVPAGRYFMMGDNRDNSSDSRVMPHPSEPYWVGFVPVENFVGRAEILFFSKDIGKDWWAFWRWIPDMRFGRFFQVIE
ncbi:MAG: signal peptidase I [Rhodospirillaceae bacterium]|jgi:signal peptidase I|nr:signal peptidase I [Rhodospirillaceae bacterium]MBT5455600.1 signal peptidase I [Rhodospirillaceae bacterium]